MSTLLPGCHNVSAGVTTDGVGACGRPPRRGERSGGSKEMPNATRAGGTSCALYWVFSAGVLSAPRVGDAEHTPLSLRMA